MNKEFAEKHATIMKDLCNAMNDDYENLVLRKLQLASTLAANREEEVGLCMTLALSSTKHVIYNLQDILTNLVGREVTMLDTCLFVMLVAKDDEEQKQVEVFASLSEAQSIARGIGKTFWKKGA